MNFYKRFIGDITAKTGGLSLARMGAYDRLLDHFYSTELPIPPEEVYSICRAMSKADRSDVDAVLARFWDATPQGYVQAKAEEVIAKTRPLIDAARENGRKGGRPRKTENPDETQRVPKQNLDETQTKPSAKALQSQSQTSLREGDSAQGAPPTRGKARKTELRADFAISERVRVWAKEKGYGQLDAHLEAFASKCKAKSYAYVDWDEGFMGAIREDWAKLRGRTPNGAVPPPESNPPTGPDPTLVKLREHKGDPMPAAVRELAEKLRVAH